MAPSFLKYDESTQTFASGLPEVQIPDLDIASFLLDHPNEHTANDHDAVWLTDPSGKTITASQARSSTDSLAKALRHDYDVQSEDVVIIFSPNSVYYPIALWACFRLGAAASCGNPAYTISELRYQIEAVSKSFKVKAIITWPEDSYIKTAKEAAAQSGLSEDKILVMEDASSVKMPSVPSLIKKHAKSKSIAYYKYKKEELATKTALLSFSSGTTGLPKAVDICHRSVVANIQQWCVVREGLNTPGKSACIACLPFYHIYGLVLVLHGNLYTGVKLVVMPKFDLKVFLDLISQHRISHLMLVPPQVVLLVKHPAAAKADLDSVETIMVGAAPLDDGTIKALVKRLPKVDMGQGYGMTETATLVTMYPQARWWGNYSKGSTGIIISNVKCRVLDPNGKRVGIGERGELCWYSPSNAKGYLNNKKATDDTWDSEGYVHSGDEGYVDKSGAVFITDRIKELIKTKGMQVAPAELEGILLSHPDVNDACVVGIKDVYAGELPKGFVVLSSNAASQAAKNNTAKKEIEESIKQFIKSKTINYKWLHEVEAIDEIPKNPSGKLLRRILRDRANQKAKL